MRRAGGVVRGRRRSSFSERKELIIIQLPALPVAVGRLTDFGC